MSRKHELREQRTGTVINVTSKKQEASVIQALNIVVQTLQNVYSIKLLHESEWKLKDIVAKLREQFAEVPFFIISKRVQFVQMEVCYLSWIRMGKPIQF